jgi:spore germination protein GerM
MKQIARLAAALVTLSACAVSSSGEFERISTADIPFGLASPVSTTTTSTTTTTVIGTDPVSDVVEQPVDLYFVLSSSVIRVQRNVASPATAAQVLALLAEGPANDPLYAGLRSALPTDFRAEVRVTRGVALVDATRTFLTALQPADQRLAVAQIVLTLTSRPGVGQVIFRVDGEAIAVPRGRGDIVDPGTPVTFDDYANLVTPAQ